MIFVIMMRLQQLLLQATLLCYDQQLYYRFMFSKQLEKINSLLHEAKETNSNTFDSIALISNSLTRPTVSTMRSLPSRIMPKYSKQITLVKQELSNDLQKMLVEMFKSKCRDLHIEFNQHNWQAFIKTFLIKNKLSNRHFQENRLNLSNFCLGPNSISNINRLIEVYSIEKIDLTKNLIDPIKLNNLTTLKELVLRNCKLGNEALEQLFDRLHHSTIERISLSSPELKDRNQLTKYDKLIELIKNSQTLSCLQLSNTEISPKNGIMQNCRNTALKKLDLSDNTNVRGVCPTIVSLNLSKNGITAPFDFPLVPLELQYLNLSYNKIPFYHFKQFLKVNYLPSLRYLILDHLQINGQVFAFQNFIQLSLNLTYLSMIDCDLSSQSFANITNGVKNSRSLRYIDLTRNRVATKQVAENIGNLIQSQSIIGLKMRHCDIKDHLGAIIFKELSKSRTLQSIDMVNNLLGDESARTICNELKRAKNILHLNLQQNIIKYKDMQEIKSYLQGNKYHSQSKLHKDYFELSQVNRELSDKERRVRSEDDHITKMSEEIDHLQNEYDQRRLLQNLKKKELISLKIEMLRKEESQLQDRLFLRQTLAVPSLLGHLSKQQSMPQNPQLLIMHTIRQIT